MAPYRVAEDRLEGASVLVAEPASLHRTFRLGGGILLAPGGLPSRPSDRLRGVPRKPRLELVDVRRGTYAPGRRRKGEADALEELPAMRSGSGHPPQERRQLG